jgi:hypothetical protein
MNPAALQQMMMMGMGLGMGGAGGAPMMMMPPGTAPVFPGECPTPLAVSFFPPSRVRSSNLNSNKMRLRPMVQLQAARWARPRAWRLRHRRPQMLESGYVREFVRLFLPAPGTRFRCLGLLL